MRGTRVKKDSEDDFVPTRSPLFSSTVYGFQHQLFLLIITDESLTLPIV